MRDRYEKVINHFGAIAQLEKLKEECLELVEAIDRQREGKDTLRSVLDEAADVLNVIRSLMTKTDAIETCAETKLLRTEIRMRTGYYDKR